MEFTTSAAALFRDATLQAIHCLQVLPVHRLRKSFIPNRLNYAEAVEVGGTGPPIVIALLGEAPNNII